MADEKRKSFLDDEKWRELSRTFQEAIAEDERTQEEYWDSLTDEQQLDAFCCVVRRILKGDVTDQGSYRYVLYEVFGWGPEAYVPAQCAGYLTIHNLIYDGIRYQEEHGASELATELATLEKHLSKPNDINQ